MALNPNPNLILENQFGTFHDIINLKTSKRKEMKKKLRENLGNWLINKNFELTKNELLDVSILLYVDRKKYKTQDVDNAAKIILDTIKKTNICEDDRQIIRLLVYKISRIEYKNEETSSLIISFRKHDKSKQMNLIENEVL